MAIKVVKPGLSTSVQDLGRPGYYHIGIPISGGMDRFAVSVANWLVGNPEDAAVLRPRDVLGFHTLGSADVIGVSEKVGSLEKGKYADFLVIDPHRMETGPVFDPYGTLVLACGTPNIERVYVGARLVVENGVSTNPDFARVCAEVNARMARLRAAVPEPALR